MVRVGSITWSEGEFPRKEPQSQDQLSMIADQFQGVGEEVASVWAERQGSLGFRIPRVLSRNCGKARNLKGLFGLDLQVIAHPPDFGLGNKAGQLREAAGSLGT